MKTDELIALLATGAGPVEPEFASRRFSMSLGWGVSATILAMAIMLGVRPDIGEAVSKPMFWLKLGFPLIIALAMYHAASVLARPGTRLGRAPAATLAAVLAAVWITAVIGLLNAVPGSRSTLVFGDTWLFCLVSIPLLSIPVFVAAIWAMKGLAPTRPTLAGAAAGLLAGSVSATVYALHCPELAPPFIATWYVLGMAVPTLAGAVLGPSVLRW